MFFPLLKTTPMSITGDDLYSRYKTTITDVVLLIQTKQGAAVPQILTTIATEVVPAMMFDVGRIKTLSGTEKRDLILAAVTLATTETFKEVNKIPELAAASWDETVRDLLLELIPPLIKLLISVEKKDVKFNKKLAGCFSCC